MPCELIHILEGYFITKKTTTLCTVIPFMWICDVPNIPQLDFSGPEVRALEPLADRGHETGTLRNDGSASGI
jgi:hypothetical protein